MNDEPMIIFKGALRGLLFGICGTVMIGVAIGIMFVIKHVLEAFGVGVIWQFAIFYIAVMAFCIGEGAYLAIRQGKTQQHKIQYHTTSSRYE